MRRYKIENNERKTIKSKYGDLYLDVLMYKNGRLAILLKSQNDLIGDLTINLPDVYILSIGGAFINSNIEVDNEIVNQLKNDGVISDSYGKIKYNYGEYEYVQFDFEKLEEYDKSGVEKYFKEYSSMTEDIKI